mgnify:CR=1 FL=1
MKHIIVSIYDKATEAYMRPWTALTENEAIRSFEDEVRREGSPINKHPDDYTLFMMGEWIDNSGEIRVCEPKSLRRAHEIKKEEI